MKGRLTPLSAARLIFQKFNNGGLLHEDPGLHFYLKGIITGYKAGQRGDSLLELMLFFCEPN